MATSFVGRMIGAATLNRAVYQEVEQDSSATGQAATVVILTVLASGIGAGISGGLATGNFVFAIIGSILGALIGWLAFAFLCYLIGTSLFKATATSGEVLRCLGFAQSPAILQIIQIIPIIGAIIGFFISIWTLVTSFVGLKEALDLSTAQTLITIILAAIVNFIIIAIFAAIFGGIGLMTGALAG